MKFTCYAVQEPSGEFRSKTTYRTGKLDGSASADVALSIHKWNATARLHSQSRVIRIEGEVRLFDDASGEEVFIDEKP